VFFLVRPRRFGKSLLCSTIASLYGGEESESLFKNLWIQNVWNFKQRQAPVISLNMSKVSTRDMISFDVSLRRMLHREAHQLGVSSLLPTETLSAFVLFTELIFAVNCKYKKTSGYYHR
jgi:hypothetical protein